MIKNKKSDAIIKSRMRKGMSYQEALDYTFDKKFEFEGQIMSISQISKLTGVSYSIIYSRLDKGMNIVEATQKKKVEKLNKSYTIDGIEYTPEEIIEKYNINIEYLKYHLLKKKKTINKTIESIGLREIKIYNVEGFKGNLREISKKYDIPYTTLRDRLQFQKLSIEEAVLKGGRKEPCIKIEYILNDKKYNLHQIAKELDIAYSTLRYRVINMKMDIEDAIKK